MNALINLSQCAMWPWLKEQITKPGKGTELRKGFMISGKRERYWKDILSIKGKQQKRLYGTGTQGRPSEEKYELQFELITTRTLQGQFHFYFLLSLFFFSLSDLSTCSWLSILFSFHWSDSLICDCPSPGPHTQERLLGLGNWGNIQRSRQFRYDPRVCHAFISSCEDCVILLDRPLLFLHIQYSTSLPLFSFEKKSAPSWVCLNHTGRIFDLKELPFLTHSLLLDGIETSRIQWTSSTHSFFLN